MQYIYIVIYIFLLGMALIAEKIKYKSHFTPIFFFSVVWCIVGIVSNTGYNEYYLPSTLANIAIILGIIIVLFVWLQNGIKGQLLLESIRQPISDFDFSIAVLLGFEAILFVMIYPALRQSINILRIYNFVMLRGADIYGIAEDIGFTNQLLSIFVRPGYTLVSIMMVLSFFCQIQKKKRIALIISTAFNLTIYTLTTAARALIVNTIVFFLIAVMIYNGGRIYNYIKTKKRYFVAIILLVVGLLFVQKQRSPNSNIINTFYTYYFSGPSFLTQLMDVNKELFPINQRFLFGSATFGFVTNIVSYFMILLTGRPQGSLYLLGSVLTNHNIRIGAHTSINAMCTCFYDFLLDWGYAGLIIGPIVVAYLARFIYKKAANRHSWGSICALIYFINVLIRTVFKWDLISTEFSMILIYIWIFTHVRLKITGK